jgi:hypothetical protein
VIPASPRWIRLFGGWLPLLAFYDPPCHRDGSPWDGQKDPGFRITTLVLGWFGYGLSFTLGAARPAPTSRPGSDRARAVIADLDEQVRAARARKDALD